MSGLGPSSALEKRGTISISEILIPFNTKPLETCNAYSIRFLSISCSCMLLPKKHQERYNTEMYPFPRLGFVSVFALSPSPPASPLLHLCPLSESSFSLDWRHSVEWYFLCHCNRPCHGLPCLVVRPLEDDQMEWQSPKHRPNLGSEYRYQVTRSTGNSVARSKSQVKSMYRNQRPNFQTQRKIQKLKSRREQAGLGYQSTRPQKLSKAAFQQELLAFLESVATGEAKHGSCFPNSQSGGPDKCQIESLAG